MLEHPSISLYNNNLFKISLCENEMSADNQQERPNYRLHYTTIVGDLCNDFARCDFHASNNDEAITKANEYVTQQKEGLILANLTSLERISETGDVIEKVSI